MKTASTVRLGELSGVDFTELALSAQGGHVNHLTLDEGYATFHVIPDHHDEYLLNASGRQRDAARERRNSERT